MPRLWSLVPSPLGKTSLLNHLLHSPHGLRIGVIVNDFSSVNVDAGLLHAARPTELVELSNGCICCTLRADLFSSVVEMASSMKVDAIFVESTGLGEPAPVAATFTFELDEDASQTMQSYGLVSLQQIVQLDCIATVVDCQAVYQALAKRMQSAEDLTRAKGPAKQAAAAGSGKKIPGSRQSSGCVVPASASATAAAALSSIRASESSSKTVQTLLLEQLEFCNVLVLNKTDLLSPEQTQMVEEFVRLNNCHAICVRATHGRVDPKLFIHSNLFKEQQVRCTQNNVRRSHDGLKVSHDGLALTCLLTDALLSAPSEL
jgi:G3E family GTPase